MFIHSLLLSNSLCILYFYITLVFNSFRLHILFLHSFIFELDSLSPCNYDIHAPNHFPTLTHSDPDFHSPWEYNVTASRLTHRDYTQQFDPRSLIHTVTFAPT